MSDMYTMIAALRSESFKVSFVDYTAAFHPSLHILSSSVLEGHWLVHYTFFFP